MSLLAVLRKSGETIASYDVPNHCNNLPSLVESMRILQEEVNQTLTSLLEGVENNEIDSEDDDADDENGEVANGVKRKCSDPPGNKKLKTS